MTDTPETSTPPANQGTQANRADILLESGTNELELLVFNIAESVYGVNVAKVREVLPVPAITVAPNQRPGVRGMFKLRQQLIPLVDLAMCLDTEPSLPEEKRKVIVTEFNKFPAAFLVDGVQQIYRLSWQDIRPLPTTEAHQHEYFTGITEIRDQLILMVDFESVISKIDPQKAMHDVRFDNEGNIDREKCRIFVADDSAIIRGVMTKTLDASGYHNIRSFQNGLECWQAIEKAMRDGDSTPCDLLVTDIEMPQMDGLHLCKRIKEHPELKHIPVVLFSSLITDDTLHKGKRVGADDQINKPALERLVEIADNWIKTRFNKQA